MEKFKNKQIKTIILFILILISKISIGQNNHLDCWGKLDSADKYFFKNDLENAQFFYESFFESPCAYDDPLLYYKLAISTQSIGKYSEAIQYYTFGLNMITFKPESFKDKNWKKEHMPTNRFDIFEIGYEIVFNDSSKRYEYFKEKWTYFPFAHKSDLILYRAQCKMELEDYIGAISDLKYYHKTIQDSNALSNYLMGIALLQPTNVKIENKAKLQKAIIYFNNAINLYEKPGPFNSEYSIFRDSYYYKAICNMILDKKQLACEDFSKAGELGKKEAYETIKKYCQ